MKRSTRLASRAAFSLVEITLALGIVTFGLVTIVALLPTGLDMLRGAANETVQARVAKEIGAQLQASDWDQTSNLSTYDGQLFYFDEQGNKTTETAPDTVFTAKVGVPTSGPSMPSTTDPSSNDNLRAVTIKITPIPAGIPDRFDNPQKYQQVAILAVKMSR